MADPSKYAPQYSFTGYQAQNPTAPLPAPQVDNELANVAISVGEAIDAIRDVRRSDGALNNQIVTPDSLSAAARVMLTKEINPRADGWAPEREFAAKDAVTVEGATYLATVGHESSNSFSDDVEAGLWLLIASPYSLSGSVFSQLWNGDGVTEVFTLSRSFYAVDELQVYVQNGTAGYELVRGVGVSPQVELTSPTQITFSSAPGAGVSNVLAVAVNQSSSASAAAAADAAAAAATSAAEAASVVSAAEGWADAAARSAAAASAAASSAAESVIAAGAAQSGSETARAEAVAAKEAVDAAMASLGPATTTTPGISRQATIAEAKSGTSTTPDAMPHVTPEGVAAAITALAPVPTVDKWSMRIIGEPFVIWDHLIGADVPPIAAGGPRFIKLTASDTYNTGLLSNETVSGTAPLITATAVVSLSNSPLYGRTVQLVNTERRFLRAGQSGYLQDDALQGHFHNLYYYSSEYQPSSGSGSYTDNVSGGATNRVITGRVKEPITDGTNGAPRTANETRGRNIGATAYMRIF